MEDQKVFDMLHIKKKKSFRNREYFGDLVECLSVYIIFLHNIL